ncbi:unannotated protein [freshwater metagenome]|uniref:Unannotated protein n=1 Tax=freshwater metagenome TaxID=449393 RepID=A0A6J6P701_9ZZZZ
MTTTDSFNFKSLICLASRFGRVWAPFNGIPGVPFAKNFSNSRPTCASIRSSSPSKTPRINGRMTFSYKGPLTPCEFNSTSKLEIPALCFWSRKVINARLLFKLPIGARKVEIMFRGFLNGSATTKFLLVVATLTPASIFWSSSSTFNLLTSGYAGLIT